MSRTLERHHWLNTIVGVLDAAFHLTDEEQYAVSNIVHKLLSQLRIPERGAPRDVPVPVAQELHSGLYSLQLESRRSTHAGGVRPVNEYDCVASIEAWRSALVGMIGSSYPDLALEERLLLTKVMTDLLAAIGVPNRAAAHFPPAVIDAHRNLDNM